MKKAGSVFETMQTTRKPINWANISTFLASFTSTALSVTLHVHWQFSPVTQLHSLSHEVVSSGKNRKTSRGRWTERYNERASAGSLWRQKTLHVVRWPSFISQVTLLKVNELTYGAKIYNSEFSATALCSQRIITAPTAMLTPIFNHHSFHLTRPILPSLKFTVIIIGAAADQFWFHYMKKSLLWFSLVLSVFRYVAFHFTQKPVMWLSVYMSLPTACVILYFVQTWHNIPLFIISAHCTFLYIVSDCGLDSLRIEFQWEVRFFPFV